MNLKKCLSMGLLYQGGGAAPVPWYLAGGVPAANCKLAYQPVGAASLAASYVNLANPGTNDAAPGTAPGFHTDFGWIFITGDQVLLTGYVPVNAATRSAIVKIDGATIDAADRWVFSSRNGAAYFGVKNTSAASKAAYSNGSSYTHTTNIASGTLAIAGLAVYLNGAKIGDIPAGVYDQGAVALQIGRISTGGQHYLGHIHALAVYDIALTPEQVATITAALP